MEAFLVPAAAVALAEVGDKTQLLSLVLAARFRRPWPIVAGIGVATFLNHAAAGVFGATAVAFFLAEMGGGGVRAARRSRARSRLDPIAFR